MPSEIVNNLKKVLKAKIATVSDNGIEDIVTLSDKKLIRDAAKIIKETHDILFLLTVVDRNPNFEMNYVFANYKNKSTLTLKVTITQKDYKIDSISGVFPSANWEEREAYDLFGIKFEGHPDLRRILLPEDWPGHPLRKDFEVTDDVRNWTGLDLKF